MGESVLPSLVMERVFASFLAGIGAGLVGLPGVLAAERATPSYLPARDGTVRLERFEVSASRESSGIYRVEQAHVATKTDTPLVNVPQAISVVTRDLIDDQSMQSLSDVARHIPGAGVAQGEGNRDALVFRGNATTADYFVDGVRDDVQYYRDLYNVDRVEVLKGPNALMFGRGGVGGVLNRVTRVARGGATREFTLQAGSWGGFRGTFDLGHGLADGAAFRLTGVQEDSESFRAGVSLRRWGVNPTFRKALGARTVLLGGFEHFRDERVADRGVSSFGGRPLTTAPEVFFGDPNRSPSDARVNTAFGTVEHDFGRGLLLRSHTRVADYDKFYQNVYPGATTPAGTEVSLLAYNQATQRENVFHQTDVVLPNEWCGGTHLLIAGIELSRQDTDNRRQTGYFTSVGENVTSVRAPVSAPTISLPLAFRFAASDANLASEVKSVAVYAQDQAHLSGPWHALAGVRIERLAVTLRDRRGAGALLQTRDSLVAPRAGLIYKPSEAASLYLSHSVAHAPRAGEQLGSLTLTNQALKPEVFRNYEFGAKWDVRPDLALSGAVYRLDRSRVVVPDPLDATRSLLVDGQRSSGLELGLVGRLSERWSVSAGYGLQEGKLTATQSSAAQSGARLAQLPRHSASAWTRWDPSRRVGFGLGMVYRGDFFTSTDNLVTVPSFVRFDGAVYWAIRRELRLQLNVENLLDRAYFASAHNNANILPGSPRAWRLGLTARW
jgi:catecholate siderophore receptor